MDCEFFSEPYHDLTTILRIIPLAISDFDNIFFSSNRTCTGMF